MPQNSSDPQYVSNRHWGFSTAGRVFFGWGVLEELRTVGKEFAAGRRSEIEAALKQMEADAAVAEKKLKKINDAGKQSWSAMVTALTETRGAFDRANQTAREAFK